MTRNHDYATPAQGTTDWHTPLNTNFADLDTDVEVRDVESNRGQYEPKSGAKFLATDTGARFVGNGSQWQELPYPSSSLAWVDAVEAGADATGSEPIDDVLATYADDGTVLAFPDGTYRLSGEFSLDGFRDFGMVGFDRPTLRIDDSFTDKGMFEFGANTPGEGLVFCGFDIDMRGSGVGAQVLYAQMNDRVRIEDVQIVGTRDDPTIESVNGEFMILMDVTDPTGTGVCRNVRALDGSNPPSSGDEVTACYSSIENVGHAIWDTIAVANFRDNGLYLSASKGQTTVRNVYAANNAIANIRVGGEDGYTVKDCKIVVDDDSVLAPRGLRIREGRGTVENVFIDWSVNTASALEVVGSDKRYEATVRDVHIVNDSGTLAVDVQRDPDNTDLLKFERVRVEGTGAGTVTGYTVRTRAPHTVFEDCEIDLAPGDGSNPGSGSSSTRPTATSAAVASTPTSSRSGACRTLSRATTR